LSQSFTFFFFVIGEINLGPAAGTSKGGLFRHFVPAAPPVFPAARGLPAGRQSDSERS